ncbi:MAG: protein kinase [Clostridia bacterium]|nr:protein kinase [Clostridia bacterium]
MNEVFSAEAVGTGYPVIIKRTLLGNNQNKKFFYSCYQKEKRALETCMCPFIPQLIDCSEDEEYAYLIETKINGDTPYANASYSEKFVIDLGIKVAHILKYLYYYGITHCDIKPDNIIVNSFGDVFLIDFGSSIFTKDESNSPYSCGTRGFAAPEQFDQKTEIDFRTDIYALGRTMLSMLVGDKISSQNAFRNECENISITCALQNPSVKAQYIFEDLAYYDKNANSSLNKVINRMVSPRKEGRYYSLDELINDLKNCIR